MKRATLVFILALLFFFSADARAQVQWWQDKVMQEKYKLSEAQVKDMDALYNAFIAKRRDLAEQSVKHQKALTALLEQERLDEQAIEKKMKELEQVRTVLFNEAVRTKIAIRKLLTPDQIKTIAADNPVLLASEAPRPKRPLRSPVPTREKIPPRQPN
jgi:Spy/CpxP family protein refolding chaperone